MQLYSFIRRKSSRLFALYRIHQISLYSLKNNSIDYIYRDLLVNSILLTYRSHYHHRHLKAMSCRVSQISLSVIVFLKSQCDRKFISLPMSLKNDVLGRSLGFLLTPFLIKRYLRIDCARSIVLEQFCPSSYNHTGVQVKIIKILSKRRHEYFIILLSAIVI